jgi:CRISPR/Cas system-associated exonuclease Cas4 (RecB family)
VEKFLRNFNYVKLPELQFELKRIDGENGRKYVTPSGNSYPSITTVLSDSTDKSFLIEWRKRVGEEEANRIVKKSSSRGTKLHSICEKYLLNELNDFKIKTMMPDIKDFFMQLKPHIDENVGDVFGLEQPLYSDRLRISGTTDCIAEWNGKLSIIDYKNSRKIKEEKHIQNYFLQCTAYAEMFEDVTKRPIEQIVVAIANEDGKPQIFVHEKHKYVSNLTSMVERYHAK